MINKITRVEEPKLFKHLKEFIVKTLLEDHRRNSSYFHKFVVEFSEKDLQFFNDIENYNQYIGFWRTEVFIDDYEYGSDGPNELTRVFPIQKEITKTITEYVDFDKTK